MTYCGADVALRQTKLGTQYFAHAKKGSCASGTETAEVMLAREAIAKAVRRVGWNVSVETPGTSGGEDGWTLDVRANREGGKPVAFKAQWGRLPLDDVTPLGYDPGSVDPHALVHAAAEHPRRKGYSGILAQP